MFFLMKIYSDYNDEICNNSACYYQCGHVTFAEIATISKSKNKII